jgi:hypothetical protein
MKNYIQIKQDDDLQLPVNCYEPPLLEVLEIAVEKGFAASTVDWNPDTW